jgi:hypothetical protein
MMTPQRILAVIAILCAVATMAGLGGPAPLLAVGLLLVAVAECLNPPRP